MGDIQDRQARQQFQSGVRISVADEDDIRERYAENLSSGGIFIRDPSPPPVGSLISLEFVLRDGSPLCRVVGRVAHSKHASVKSDETAGMGVEFVEYDEAAQAVLANIGVNKPAPIKSDERKSEGDDLRNIISSRANISAVPRPVRTENFVSSLIGIPGYATVVAGFDRTIGIVDRSCVIRCMI